MNNIVDTSAWPSVEQLRARMKTETRRAIATSLGTSRTTLQKYLNGESAQIIDADDPAVIIASDRSFVAMMHKAIKAGQETATVGIRTMPGPSRARLIHAPMAGSGCGSPAAMCASA